MSIFGERARRTPKYTKACANAGQKLDETEEVDRVCEAEKGTRGDCPVCETGEFGKKQGPARQRRGRVNIREQGEKGEKQT